MSDATGSGFTLTVTSAADETAMHGQPYAFSTDDGSTWSAWQASATYVATGLAAQSSYQARHKVRDQAGNESIGAAVTADTITATVLSIAHTDRRRLPVNAASDSWTANIGPASTGRRVAVVVGIYKNTNPTAKVTSLSIGGVAAIKAVGYVRDSRLTVDVWTAVVPSGTTAVVDIAFNMLTGNAEYLVSAITGGASVVGDVDTSASPGGTTVTPAASGVILSASGVYSTTSAPTWTGATEMASTMAGVPNMSTASTAGAGVPVTTSATWVSAANLANVAVAVDPA